MKFSMDTLSPETVSELVTRQRVYGEKLECILYIYKPGARFPVHDHESEQITYVLDGELVFEFDDENIHLSRGEGIIIAGNRPHGAYVPDDAIETHTLNIFTPVRATLPTA